MNKKTFEQMLGTGEESVLKMLEKWAEEIGNKTFIYYGEESQSITFREFNELANSFAHRLINTGIQKGDRISLFLKNPLVTTIAMFGIWKAGAVFCPINFNYTSKLLSYQINDTEPKMLITERQMVSTINKIKTELSPIPVMIYEPEEEDHDYQAEVVSEELDEKFSELSFQDFLSGNSNNPSIELYYYDTANIIYTSGTTGPAKGVVQSYRYLHNYTYTLSVFNNQEDVLYNDLPMYHVGGAFANVARAAFVGCTVAMWDKFSPTEFWYRIEVSKSSNAILLSVMIPWLMNADSTENDRNNTLNRVILMPLPEHHNEIAKRFGFNFLFTGFGQTESGTGIGAIIDELGEDERVFPGLYKGYTREETKEIASRLNIPFQKGDEKLPKGYMGVPSPFMEAAILNEQDEECEIGKPGQIAFRPLYPNIILKEYFNKPEATVEAFQNLWFHTGDVGYKDENGFYYFVDRMKDVIRHRGENISSYQVEDMINQHDQVIVCAAFPVPAEEGSEDDIVVYVVPKTDQLSIEILHQWAKIEMPKFMRPKHIRLIDDLPKTPTNKIEKYKLKLQFQQELRIEV